MSYTAAHRFFIFIFIFIFSHFLFFHYFILFCFYFFVYIHNPSYFCHHVDRLQKYEASAHLVAYTPELKTTETYLGRGPLCF